MPGAALKFDKVRKAYGRFPVLDGVDFAVAEGESLGLVGVNGAGKTTLLKCLLDFCALGGGAIEIFGVPHSRPAARARLAYLPERFTPPYYLTGRDFLNYMGALQGEPPAPARAEDVLRALDFDPAVLGRPVRILSKGMTQKLGLAAVVLGDKDLYVLDEPLSGLDPKARALTKGLLLELKKSGRTLFFTSHSLADAAELSDRVAVLHQGQVRFCGPPQGLGEAYGESNLEQAFLRCIEAPARRRGASSCVLFQMNSAPAQK